MRLFDPDRHYPLLQLDWNPSKTRQAIIAIANETIAQLKTTSSLPGHPMDDSEFGSDLYFGKAGVLWMIDYLQTVGAIDSTFDVTAHIDETLEQSRQDYSKRSPYPEQSSYLFGQLPLILLQYKLSPTEDKAVNILNLIWQNNTQPVRELMWGIAGSMLAAYLMYQWTQESRWQEVFQSQAQLFPSTIIVTRVATR